MVMIGDKLKKLREDMGLTQVELAEKLGITRSALSLYELGKREPDHKTLKTIAKFFDAPTDYLLGLPIDCIVCGYNYVYPLDNDKHSKHHNKVIAIREKHGFYYTPYEQEQIKKQADKISNSDTSTKAEKVTIAEELLKAFFSRELLKEDFVETSFNDWALEDLRSQNNLLKGFPTDVREAIIEKYNAEVESRELPDTVAPYLPEGFDELTPEARKEVLDFIDYVMHKYKKEDK